MNALLQPVQLGAWSLRNRIVMAPLTRCRAEPGRIPGELMVDYYRQRVSAGLIISEATAIAPSAVGYPDTPGIWNEQQIEGWKKVTDAVHKEGGLIIMQLWHVGRISHLSYLGGALPVAPSAIKPAGHVSLIRPKAEYPTPRALETAEITDIIQAYKQGAANAKAAGFDGVEIHGANGYLLEQFLLDGCNKRTDQYGGNLENRARLMLEVTDAVIEVWGADRVGMHLSPRADAHDVSVTDRLSTYRYIAEQLGQRQLAFICTREHIADDSISLELKDAFAGNYIANENIKPDVAENYVATGKAEAVAFGKSFISNPDLVQRITQDLPLNKARSETFYASGSEGYTDYPIYQD